MHSISSSLVYNHTLEMQWWLSIQNGIRQCAGIRINQSWQPNRWNPRIHNMCGPFAWFDVCSQPQQHDENCVCVPLCICLCLCQFFSISIIVWHILIVFIYWQRVKTIFLWDFFEIIRSVKLWCAKKKLTRFSKIGINNEKTTRERIGM